MKIISWNVNGLKTVVRNVFLDWIEKESPDILCLQEIGRRIDYIFVSSSLSSKIKDAFILKDVTLGSDHCPTVAVITT